LQVGKVYCDEKLRRLSEVRQLVLHELDEIADFCVVPPAEGAFYFLIRFETGMKPLALVERLVREHGVAAIPGDAFGMDNGCYLRIAYGALEKETVAEGVGRLTRGIKSILGA
jgi:aspartate/methionine/tyrosine aminotransferase